MATSIVGAPGPYDPATMQWTSYAERMSEFFIANAIDNAKRKVAILLNEVGTKNYELLRALFAPDQPNTKSFKRN